MSIVTDILLLYLQGGVKLCKVAVETVVIPVMPEIRWWDRDMADPSTVVDIQKRYVHLVPREIDGQHILAAYDHETATLFIKE